MTNDEFCELLIQVAQISSDDTSAIVEINSATKEISKSIKET
jgi:hypothetical protein